MKCEEFIDKLENLSADKMPQAMEKHMVECDDCREYHSIIFALTPKVYPKTPESIKENVLKRAKRNQQFKAFITMKTKASRLALSAVAVVAVTFGVVILGNPTPAQAAQKMIDKSLSSVSSVKNMAMRIDVRTYLSESFSYINVDAKMVEHKLVVVRGDQTKWRLDKGGRTIVFDGTTKYLWIPEYMYSKGDQNTSFEEWFDILLNPEMMLFKEKFAIQNRGNSYSMKESGDKIIMTANVKAQGDFTNPYMRNTSIRESDTRREIVFDKQTNLISSMKIYVKEKSREILVVDIKSIEYNTTIDQDELTSIPAGHEWRDVNAVVKSSGKFAGITPEEAARIIFNAFENNDPEAVKETFIQYDFDKVCNYMYGVKVINIGKSFKSDEYVGVFVPYEVNMADGKIVKYNIALRSDNANKEWIVDGGI